MDKSVVEYLESQLNRTESVLGLLLMYIEQTKSREGALFVYTDIKSYECICHADSSHEILSNDISLTVDVPLTGIIIGSDDKVIYNTFYTVDSMMLIPIVTERDVVGVVVLTNSEVPYVEELLSRLSAIVSLTQTVLWKHKMFYDYKKVCEENSKGTEDIFLANIGHEIRSPLNGVIGYSQLLAKTSLTSTQKTYINSMNGCSLQLMQIINDVIDFSKITAGKMPVTLDCVNVQDILASLNDATSQSIDSKRQTIHQNIAEGVPEYIICDKQKVVQILVNLVTNANKFTGVNGVIVVSLSNTSKGLMRVSVKDNGIGISEKDQCNLFNAFSQVRTNTIKSGSGLGLSISKKLTELLGGTIEVQSCVNYGSTFTFTFEYQEYTDFEKLIDRNVKDLNNKKVLLVDDNVDNRILLSEMLYDWGMIPIVCASAKEALLLVKSNRHDLSIGLIDICMPDMSGPELAKEIKSEFPLMPLIALSSVDSFSGIDFDSRLYKMSKVNKVQLFNAIHNIITKVEIKSVHLTADDNTNTCDYQVSQVDTSHKVLIVEDIDYNRCLLVNILHSIGYDNITQACDGQEAYDEIKRSVVKGDPFQIMLLDLRMPIMDGYDVIRVMRNHGWKLPHIVVITASVMDIDKEKCKDMGVEYFLTKPIHITKLRDIMSTLSIINP